MGYTVPSDGVTFEKKRTIFWFFVDTFMIFHQIKNSKIELVDLDMLYNTELVIFIWDL